MNQRENILKIIDQVPSLPSVAIEVQSLIRNKDVDFRQLAEKIKYDPGLTANILSLANSAYFAFSRPVNSIADAIVLMGTKRIFELIMAESIAPIVHKSVKGYDLPAGKLWEHSVSVAVASEYLIKELDLKDTEYIFTAGLLHNVGKIILGTFVEIETEPILELALKKDISFDEAEKLVLGIDHAEAGAILLESWKLPVAFINVAKYHHRPTEYKDEDSVLIDIVHIADALVMMSGIGTGADGLKYHVCQKVMNKYGIEKKLAERVIADMLVGLNDLKLLVNK